MSDMSWSHRMALPRTGQSDMLCSVVLIANERFCESPDMLAGIRTFLDDHFRFFEVLVVVRDKTRREFPDVFDAISLLPDTRILVVRSDIDVDRMMPLAASESIGDFVIFLADEEYELVDLEQVWNAASTTSRSVLLFGRRVGTLDRIGSRLLSGIVGFKTDVETLRSCAHFRERISWLLQRSDSTFAFRFSNVWNASGDRTVTLSATRPAAYKTLRRPLLRRLLIAADLLGHAAPRLLKILAIASLTGLGGSFVMILYATTLLLFVGHLAPGWFSVTLAISASTGFISAALGCIALGLAQILEMRRQHANDDLLQQVSNIDRFKHAEVLNVVMHRP